MASARGAEAVRHWPRTAEVIVKVPGFLTPRMDMQRCSASTTTSTPLGASARSTASAIFGVIRPWDFQAPGIAIHQTGEFGQSGNPSIVAGDIGHVGSTHERHHVVLTQRCEGDISHHHHLVMLSGEGDLEVMARVFIQAGEELLVHVGDPGWRPEEAVAFGVLAHGLQNLMDGPFDSGGIDAPGASSAAR